MQLISPDVLADANGLSVGAGAFALLVGTLLWWFGWRWHKFWVVFTVTLAAGLLGLTAGRVAGVSVLVVGLLLALAAGMLALEIAKISAFVTGGTAAWVTAQAVVPQAQELWAVFLCGGLLGVVLYRLWTMFATSYVGFVLSGHAVLLLLENFNLVNAREWADRNSAWLNAVVLAMAVIGVVVQAKITPDPKADGEAKAEKEEAKEEKKEAKEEKKASPWYLRVLPTRWV